MEAYQLYPYIKSLHLIFVITWFSGLFYIPRLFIYQIEAHQKTKIERDILLPQLQLMTKRLWFIITWPSAILATLFALWLLHLAPDWLQESWMHVKLGFVVLLFAYHFKCHAIYKQLLKSTCKWTSNQMRLWNEGSTIILFSVVFLVILKNAFNWIYGVVGIIALAILLMLGIRLYKRLREK
ncbi:CopD family protein [Aquimarina agarivorans]|uniref:CopD family protein n=1 Tax=Aquimarina agarivorans TaxID=980584 RepID=UPI000248E7C7|nr:CopD family protein [Aquimarina agarivorans]